jgi:hypothetical protein
MGAINHVKNHPFPSPSFRAALSKPRNLPLFPPVDIEALCATPPGALTHSPSQMPLSCPSGVPGRPELVELHASAPSPTPTRAEEHIATTPDCRPRAPAPSPTPTRAKHLSGLQIVRRRALARRRAQKGTAHYTCWCERKTLHVKRWECFQLGRPQPRAAVAYSAIPASVLTSVVPTMCAAVLTMRLVTGDVCCRCDDALSLPWCRSTRSCATPTKSRWAVKPTEIAHVAPIATTKQGKRQAENPRTASPLTSLITAAPARRGAHASPF